MVFISEMDNSEILQEIRLSQHIHEEKLNRILVMNGEKKDIVFRQLKNNKDFEELDQKLGNRVYATKFRNHIKHRCGKLLPTLSLLFNDTYLSQFNLRGVYGKQRLLGTGVYEVYLGKSTEISCCCSNFSLY